MPELDEFELSRTGAPEEPGPPPPEPPPSRDLRLGAVAATAVGVLAAAAVGYLALRRSMNPAPTPMPAPRPAVTATTLPSPSPTAIALPPLDESDALVRELAGRLSLARPLAAGLLRQGLIRIATAAVANVAEGDSPAPHLSFLAPRGGFAVATRRGRLVVDPRSYARYDAAANAVAAVDAAALADLYRQLGPLFEVAYRELGAPEGTFSRALARAIDALVRTPVADGDVEVEALGHGIEVYRFVDPRLEGLPPSPKHLLRMGPDNARKVQAKLRELAQALGLAGAG
jgi:hypothetical protein